MSSATVSHRLSGLLGAAALMLALGACGGDDPDGSAAPTDAELDHFCETVGELDTSDVDKFVDTLLEVGTPEDISKNARAGFEVMVEKADQDEISSSDEDKVDEFVAYIALTCHSDPTQG